MSVAGSTAACDKNETGKKAVYFVKFVHSSSNWVTFLGWRCSVRVINFLLCLNLRLSGSNVFGYGNMSCQSLSIKVVLHPSLMLSSRMVAFEKKYC